MKKIFIFLLLGIFLISFSSAAEWDNSLKYSENDLKVELENWFGFGTTYGSAELKSHQSIHEVRQVSIGKDRVVMWYDFSFRELYENGIGGIEFIDMWSKESYQRDYKLVYWGQEEVNIYGMGNCKNTLANGTGYNCAEVILGTETVDAWLPYNSRDVPKGDIRIGLSTDVKPGERTDVVWTLGGKRISKHAEFSGVGENSDNIQNDVGSTITVFLSNLTARTSGIITRIQLGTGDGSTLTTNTSIIQNGVILASKLQSSWKFDTAPTVTFGLSDYLDNGVIRQGVNDGNFTIKIIRTGGSGLMGVDTYSTFAGTLFNYTGQDMIAKHSGEASVPLYTFNQTLDNPDIILNSPVDNLNTTINTITFNATVTDRIKVLNVSLIIDGIVNETNTSGINNTNYIFTKTIAEGVHNWSILAWNNISLSATSDVRTFTIDTTPPVISAENPIGTLDYNSIGGTEFLNVTFTDISLNSCWYNYNGTNVTITGCQSGVKNSTGFILLYKNTNMTIYANDSIGNFNSQFLDWDYFILENSQTFDTTALEGSTKTFSINYTANETPISANFIYNGSSTSADIDATGFPIVILSESITVPAVSVETNLSFLWNVISLTGNSNTTTNNQTVSILQVDNCSVFTFPLFNYTVVDEATQSVLDGSGQNVSLELDVSIFSEDRSLQIIDFSTIYSGVNPNALCSQTNLSIGQNYVLDSTAKYSSAARAIEYYNVRGYEINNQSNIQEITLFDIKTSESTDFQITFKNSDFVVVENALIQVNRQYVSEGVFKTVELPITDSNGQAVVHLVRNDIVYNYIVTKNGVVLGTFNNLVAFCEDETIGQCFIPLNALQGTTPTFNPSQDIGISSSFVFNSTSRDLILTFSTNDGSVRTVLLNATKMDQLGNTTVCSTSITSASGTLTCNVPVSLGNETIITFIFVDGELKLTDYFSAAQDIILGDGGYFLLLFLVISLGLMFAESKSMMIGGIILGFIAGGMLFFIKGGIIGAGSAVMWLIIMGIMLIWKLQSEGQT